MSALLKRFTGECWNIFIAPRSVAKNRKGQEYILNIILLGSIAMLVLLDASAFYYSAREGVEYHGISFVAFSLLPIFFVFLYALSRRGFFVSASYLLIAAYFASDSYAAYEWGINLQTVVLGYALIIVISSILIGTRFGFFVTALTGAYIVPLWYAQWHQIISIVAEEQRPDTNDAAVFIVIYFFIMIVAWLSNCEIEKSLSRARSSELALTAQRDLLEITVEERTRKLRESQFEKVEQLYRFAEFGQLASGLFHDFLNLMNAKELQNDSAIRKVTEGRLDDARKVSKRIENFTQAIRRQLGHEETQEEFSIADSIAQVIQLLSYKANKEKTRILFKDGADGHSSVLKYFGDPFKFHQAMMNLILNAMESYEKVPKESHRNRAVHITATREGGVIVIRVVDNGCGIGEDITQKIFEPFFTTKRIPNGMGIGLATVKKIVEKDFHGTILVESKSGKGATFTLKFPG